MTLITLDTIQSGSSPHSLVFFPGGPGLSWHCFETLIDSQLPSQTMYGLNYAPIVSNESTYFDELKFELILLLQRIPNPILVTHSFSSMLTLSMERIPSLKGLILLNPAIDNSYTAGLPDRLKEYTDFDGTAAAASFWLNPSDATYAKYFKDFLPFYFRPIHLSSGRKILENCTFSHKPYFLFVQYFLPHFTKSHPPTIPTLILAGDDDYICPPSLFKDSLITHADNISIKIIKGAGHFPWIDTPHETVSALKDWYETFNRRPTTTP